MKQAAVWVMCAMVLTGCVSRQQFDTRMLERKAASLEQNKERRISAIVPFPEREGSETEVRENEPVNFLSAHTGGLAIGEEFSDEQFGKAFEGLDEIVSESGASFKVMFPGSAGIAACAPVTADGYFLTAGHTTDYSNAYILYVTSDRDRTYMAGARCRVVTRDEARDWAILRADMATPRFLRFRSEELKEGDVLFGGNAWRGYCGTGEVVGGLKIYYEASDRRFRSMRVPLVGSNAFLTSFPSINGDSGSPLVDSNGKLCGILVGGGLDFDTWRYRRRSYVTRLDEHEVMDAIAKDREAQAAGTSGGDSLE